MNLPQAKRRPEESLTPIFVTLVTDIGVILSGVRLSASPRQIPI